MNRLNVKHSAWLLLAALAALAVWWMPERSSGPSSSTSVVAAEPKSDKLVTLKLRIEDSESGLRVEIDRKVPAGSTALAAMQQLIAMETKEFSGLGLFVTSLCGVKAPAGKFWSPEVDGVRAMEGISNLKIDKDLELQWKIKDGKS